MLSHCAECCIFVVMLSVLMLSVIMLSVIVLSVSMLSVIILSDLTPIYIRSYKLLTLSSNIRLDLPQKYTFWDRIHNTLYSS